uniref:WD repeat-containing protein 60 n=1 Tax=Parascaris univalens TaxID=6257 RepID=A0A915C399_PARUN
SRSSSKEILRKNDSVEKHRRSAYNREERKTSDDTNERKSTQEKSSSHSKERRRSSHSRNEKTSSSDKDLSKRKHSKERSSHRPSKESSRESKVAVSDGNYLAVKVVVEPEPDRRPPTSIKRPISASKSKVIQPEPPPPVPTNEEEEYLYEDDFEDYSDDFEEDSEDDEETHPTSHKSDDPKKENTALNSNTELEYLQKYNESPMLQRILNRLEPFESSTLKSSEQKVTRSPRISSAQRKIDFSNATVTNFDALSEASTRYDLLKHLVDMEVVYFDFLNLAPLRDYDFYMEMFGDGNRIQVQTQTGDDDLHREVQTEDIDTEIKWTQHPPVDELGWGSIVTSNAPQLLDSNEEDPYIALYKVDHLHSEKLRKFISVAAQVIIELIAASTTDKQLSSMQRRSNMSFSAGYNIFSLGKLATASKVTCIRHNDSRLLIAFYVNSSVAEDIVDKSLLVEFRCGEPQPPERVMLCENEVRCCCYSPDGSSAVFVGLADGSCLAFDLREPSSIFESTLSTLPWPETTDDYCLRLAAYDTSFGGITWKSGKNEEQDAPIVDIHAVGEWGNDITQSYQVISINQAGTITIWAVIDGSSMGADMDLGLRPGATLKMSRVDTLKPDKVIMNNSMGRLRLIVNAILPNPLDRSQFLLATDAGFILNVVRMKGITFSGPRIYKADIDVTAEVLCERISNFDPSIILAGLSNGHIALYKLNRAVAILVLIPPNSSRKPVTHVEFSPRCESVFYSIHGGIRLLVWDIATGKSPIAVFDLEKEFQASVLCTSTWSEKTKRGNDETTFSFLALGLSNGQTQVHTLERLCTSQTRCSFIELVEILNHKL